MHTFLWSFLPACKQWILRKYSRQSPTCFKPLRLTVAVGNQPFKYQFSDQFAIQSNFLTESQGTATVNMSILPNLATNGLDEWKTPQMAKRFWGNTSVIVPWHLIEFGSVATWLLLQKLDCTNLCEGWIAAHGSHGKNIILQASAWKWFFISQQSFTTQPAN